MRCRCAADVEEVRQRPGILSASLFLGFPYADVPEMGSAVLVVADGDRQLAEAVGDRTRRRSCGTAARSSSRT